MQAERNEPQADHGDLHGADVCKNLRISQSTLNHWIRLGALSAPPVFQTHKYRGRRRVWTERAFAELRAEIEKESEPGGLLARWRLLNARDGGTRTAQSAKAAAQSALEKVLAFRFTPRHSRER